jgi:hypothetical protein
MASNYFPAVEGIRMREKLLHPLITELWDPLLCLCQPFLEREFRSCSIDLVGKIIFPSYFNSNVTVTGMAHKR